MTMFSIYDGRPSFWQWDLGQKLIVSDDTCCEVHFDNGTTQNAPVCKVFEENGKRLVNVPNIFLQSDKLLKVFAYVVGEDDKRTIHSEIFKVLSRSKPEDYVYTETEVLTWESLDDRITKLERGGGGGAQGEDGASAYEIAVEHGFEGSEAEWLESLHGSDGQDGKDGTIVSIETRVVEMPRRRTLVEIHAMDPATHYDEITVFNVFDGQDGKDGKDGQNGQDGYTPQKGIDYYTEADKAEMVEAVLAAMPNGDEVAY